MLAVIASTIVPCFAHTVLDPELGRSMLVEIAAYNRQAKESANAESKAEALFRLGEKVQELVAIMNQDLAAHNQIDAVAQIIVRRLDGIGVRIALREKAARYAYDMAALREYLRLMPYGIHASEARFQLLAENFYQRHGSGLAETAPIDPATLIGAVEEEEAYLTRYPQDGRCREVRFFLAADYYRLSRSANGARYQQRAVQSLQQVMTSYPGSVEARSASVMLDELKRK
jgi:hypothetical protein